jgi:pseudoazurin
MLNRRSFALSAGALALIGTQLPLSTSALAAEVQIQMLNVDPDDRKRRMIFDPLITVVEAGDTVKFVATDKSHNTASIEGMLPEGSTPWKGKINEEVTITFDVPGFYGYKCTPHQGMGMVGLVIVRGDGMLANYEAARSVEHRGRAKKVWEEIWAEVEAQNLLG